MPSPLQSIHWRGIAPSEPTIASLRAAGFAIDITQPSRDPADDLPEAAVPIVVSTERAALPRAHPGQPWIWLCTAAVSEETEREATLRGAYAVISTRSAGASSVLAQRLSELTTIDPVAQPPADLVMQSAVSRRALARAARAAATAMPVLLIGETGTGKEVIAKLIHSWSRRAKRPLVAINCAAIPNELMEAELFGYARGAFSGAVQRYDGQLMAAEGGTVFLDEIHETPLETQVKLLRVLEDRVVSRLGENVWHQVDFRVIAATNRDLRVLIQAGLFGEDLYERLAIVTIRLAPLRERTDDLPRLATQFAARFAREQDRPAIDQLSPAALRVLVAYPWPGNIRELRNVIYETLVFKRAGSEILLSDLPRRILKRGAAADAPTIDRRVVARKIDAGDMDLRAEIDSLQRVAIEEALRRSNGNAAQAARLLGAVGRGVARDPGGTLRAIMRRLDRDGKSTQSRRRQ